MVTYTADREDAAVLQKRGKKRKGKKRQRVTGGRPQMCCYGDARCAWKPDLRPVSSLGGKAVLPFPDLLRVCAHFPGGLVSREEPMAGWALSPAPGPALGRWAGAYRPSLPLACFPNPLLRPPLTVPFTLSKRSPSAPGQSLCSAPQGAPPTKAPPAALTVLARQSPCPNCGVPGAPGT